MQENSLKKTQKNLVVSKIIPTFAAKTHQASSIRKIEKALEQNKQLVISIWNNHFGDNE